MKYDIIYIDPPWNYKRSSGQGVVAEQYKTLSDQDIYNLPISDLANKNCALICWMTFPKISEGVKAIESWGFEIKTVFVNWIKLNKKNLKPFFGIGSYTKSNGEYCILATRGKIHPWVLTNSLSSVLMSPIEKHSKKPNRVRDMITEIFGDRSRVEIFAREKFDGWDAIGYDLDGMDILESIEVLKNK